MKRIDEQRLETDLGYRFEYLAEFIGFGEHEVRTIHEAAKHLAPLVPSLVDAVYDQLFSYDATKRHFLPRQSGYDGPVPDDLESLEQDHAIIQFRKQHLGRYLERLVTKIYDEEMVKYLDLVGKIHTSAAGSETLNVPLVQMNALLGFVADALLATILGLGVPDDNKTAMIRAFNKLLWIQNDLVNRHYKQTHEQTFASD